MGKTPARSQAASNAVKSTKKVSKKKTVSKSASKKEKSSVSSKTKAKETKKTKKQPVIPAVEEINEAKPENPETSIVQQQSSSKNEIESKKKMTLEEKQAVRLKKHQQRLEASKEYRAKRSEKNFYCTNKQLLAELIKWRDSAENPEDRVITQELYDMITHIAKKLTNHSNFIRYPWYVKEEMISYAQYKIWKGLKGYNFKFSNPFSYMTQSCWNSFLIVLRKHYKDINIKRELIKDRISQIEETKEFNQKNLYNYMLKQFLGEVDPDSGEAYADEADNAYN